MRGNRYFDFSRFGLLLRMELFRSRKGVLWAVVLGIFIFPLVDILTLAIKDDYFHNDNYACGLMVAGFVLSSLAFNDLGNTLKSYQYLTLPASTLEKFVCMWLLTSVSWTVLFSAVFGVFAFLVNPVAERLFVKVDFHPFDPLGPFALETMRYYFVLQGIFLLGAAFFRGYVFPKTLLALIALFAVTAGIIWLLLSDIFLTEHVCTSAECELVDAIAVHPSWEVVKWLFWWLLAPALWVVTWFGLKEKEV